MKTPWKSGRAFIAVLCVLLALVVSACGNGDDDDDDDNGSATSTTTAPAADATPTTALDSQATATDADVEPTAATGGDDLTPTESNGATTPATSTTPATDDELGELDTLDPELLPNFSLTMNFVSTNLSGVPETTLRMQMEQSDIDNYHFNMDSDGEMLEFWTIGEESWTSIGGEVMESPTGSLFNPADILTTGDLIPEGLNAQREGTEEVNGRETTKWVVDGADYVAFMNAEAASDATGIEMTDGAGEVVVWVDNELNIMLKAEGDVTWSNSDGTDGSLIYDYEIHDIGSTADVTAPQ